MITSEVFNIILIICIIGCLIYIYWLQHSYSDNQNKIIEKLKIHQKSIKEPDDVSFLKSNYEPDLISNHDSLFAGDDEKFPDE